MSSKPVEKYLLRVDAELMQWIREQAEANHRTISEHEGVRALRDDRRRQEWITGELGCDFVRCDYKHDDIRNVMKVVKAIYSKTKI